LTYRIANPLFSMHHRITNPVEPEIIPKDSEF
jgi:hypothetical protein